MQTRNLTVYSSSCTHLGEFGLIFEIADAKPLAGNELGSVAYFPAKVREQVEQIFRNLDVIQLSRCVSMWNVWTQCTFERIEPGKWCA